ncbi:hypothetical protein [Nonomuraea jabiensis]|uniref:Uncharacterized protein n=1 Tax=Nonomuraea jabiensis TaxID=882448 RepID=A0A7W9GJN5_9ACTN|nr:hypothetical protein [Nonomuraea jabiensis]MBB5785010.1 hypothetical protein [Nonomuraea jabiensis]
MLQPITSATPRGTTVKRLSMTSGSPLAGFSQRALAAEEVMAA